MAKNTVVSASVIKRLPRYYRFLGEMKNSGTIRKHEKSSTRVK